MLEKEKKKTVAAFCDDFVYCIYFQRETKFILVE